jgi:hypothetical protein
MEYMHNGVCSDNQVAPICIKESSIMTVERITFAIVGILVMATVAGYLLTLNAYFLYATAFVGLMVFQAPFSKFCPLPMILKMLGVKTGTVFE